MTHICGNRPCVFQLLVAARELLEYQDVSFDDRLAHKAAKLRLDQTLHLVRMMHNKRSMRFPNGMPRTETGGRNGDQEDSADSKDH